MSRLVRSILLQSQHSMRCRAASCFSQPIRCLSDANSISDKASFPGYKGSFSTGLHFNYPENTPRIQCYRVMDTKGAILDTQQDPQVNIKQQRQHQDQYCRIQRRFILFSFSWKLDEATCLRILHTMIMLSKLDTVMYEAQRQGRITFYLQNYGE